MFGNRFRILNAKMVKSVESVWTVLDMDTENDFENDSILLLIVQTTIPPPPPSFLMFKNINKSLCYILSIFYTRYHAHFSAEVPYFLRINLSKYQYHKREVKNGSICKIGNIIKLEFCTHLLEFQIMFKLS